MLQRTKAANLNDFGRPGEQSKECPDAYTFSDGDTGEVTRVLVVDDFVVNGPTLAAIANAIHSQLPQVKVLFFALGRIEENEQNSHLDVRYFTSTKSPMPSAVVASTHATKREAIHDAAPQVKRDHVSVTDLQRTRSVFPKTSVRAAVSQVVTVKRVGVLGAVLVTVFGLALLSGGYVLFANRLPANDASFYQVPALTISGQDAPVVADPVRPASGQSEVTEPVNNLPAGVVVVPSVGLRSEHFVDAKVLRTKVRNGEKVYILKKVSSSTGTRWVQIKTKSGNVGWVWASVVREIRQRALAAR